MPYTNVSLVWGLVVANRFVFPAKRNQPKIAVCDADKIIVCVRLTISLTM